MCVGGGGGKERGGEGVERGGGLERGGNKIRTKGWEGKYGMKRGKTKNRRKEGGG